MDKKEFLIVIIRSGRRAHFIPVFRHRLSYDFRQFPVNCDSINFRSLDNIDREINCALPFFCFSFFLFGHQHFLPHRYQNVQISKNPHLQIYIFSFWEFWTSRCFRVNLCFGQSRPFQPRCGIGEVDAESTRRDTMFDPKTFEETVSKVATEDNEAGMARTAKTKAEGELLERVIEMAKPALKAVGTRPQIAYHISHHADVNYYGGVQTEERYAARCVPLSADKFGPEEDCPRANEGRYEGRVFAVRDDGVLVQLTYSGDWSRWQGSSFGYTADVQEYRNALDAIQDGWAKVDEYIERLSKALEGAVGKRKSRTETDRKRADKVTAVFNLLKK